MLLTQSKLASLRKNIFPRAHGAIEDWHAFDWHRDQRGEPQSDKLHSSQALAIDVFGAMAAAPEHSRDKVLGALAAKAGLPSIGPWAVELEWSDPANLLREPRQTQVDAFVSSPHALMVIECKFTEPGGSCSQTKPLRSGKATGLRQCDGNYRRQVHPVSGLAAFCPLSGKGIRYWDVIPHVFACDPTADHLPCPFKGETFQWMRNMVLTSELSRTLSVPARCLVVYAANGDFPTERKARELSWLPPLANGANAPLVISFQEIAAMACEQDAEPIWRELSMWIDRKVSAVKATNTSGRI